MSNSTSRENTVLRGELFERSEENPSIPSVNSNVYVIPNAIVAERFQPGPPQSTNTSKDLFFYQIAT